MGRLNSPKQLRHIPLSYNTADSQASALRLVLTLFPDWEHTDGQVEFIRFKDGITNTLLKAVKRRPDYSEEQIDNEAVLLRAYGKGTEVLIDRAREATSHALLSQHNLAPDLLARFQNGLMYKFIRGRVCQPQDLRMEPVWKGVARTLAQWHAILPIVSEQTSSIVDHKPQDDQISRSPSRSMPSLAEINAITPNKSTPNIWTVMQKWVFALPIRNDEEKKQQAQLQRELKRTVEELGDLPGLGADGLVLGHCDLLSGNVIMHPPAVGSSADIESVAFIDYEYATPAPAAFDIANHFAEWGGFDCDFSVIPTRSVRRAFITEYLASYYTHLSAMPKSATTTSTPSSPAPDSSAFEVEVDKLFNAVDQFRGIPGFYWGIWALIQATISQIDFDYVAYAPVRLGEYWDWRAVEEGKSRAEMGIRERRWAEE